MAAIKPGLMNIFFQRYDKSMIKQYFLRIKHTNYDKPKKRGSMFTWDSAAQVSGGKLNQNNILSDQEIYELEKKKRAQQKEE